MIGCTDTVEAQRERTIPAGALQRLIRVRPGPVVLASPPVSY